MNFELPQDLVGVRRNSYAATLSPFYLGEGSTIITSVAADLAKVVLNCLAKEPGQRPQTARDVRDELTQCQACGAWSEQDAAEWWQKRTEAER